MTTRRRTLGALLVMLAMALALTAPHGAAQTAVETGWWWKGNPGAALPLPADQGSVPLPVEPPALPPPPNAGEGLMVAAAPDGAFAIAAVRSEDDAEALTLTVAENGNFGGENAHLFACTVVGGWTPAAGGRWIDKPVAACDLSQGGGSVAGIRADDGSWTFPIGALAGDGVNVAIVPAADALPGGVVEPFQLVFKAPTGESLQLAPATDGSVDDFDDPEPSFSAVDDEGAGGVFDPSTVVGDESFAPVAVPALPPAEQAPRLIAPARVIGAGDDDSTARTVAVLVFLLAAAAVWLTSQRARPLPASLARVGVRTRAGPAAPPTTGGLGRFQRTRAGKPPSLF